MRRATKAPLIGLIASKNPVQALEVTVQSLFKGGCSRVVVVNDGSDTPESKRVFKKVAKLGAEVIHLEKNVGKAKALRAGFMSLPKKCVIVQTDDDTIAGDLSGPLQLIHGGKADIVDVRIEVVRTNTLLGIVQEANYWMVNAICKRVQSWFDARVWLSGAAIMYTYEAGKALVKDKSRSITEDTEGLYRARAKGHRIRFYAGHEAQFLTMVPEDLRSLNKQWRRWTTGNGQLMQVYGLGGGNARVATANIVGWLIMLAPIIQTIRTGIVASALQQVLGGLICAVVAAIRLRRPILVIGGLFMPFVALLWIFHAYRGLYLGHRMTKAGKTEMTWVSPKRTQTLEMPA